MTNLQNLLTTRSHRLVTLWTAVLFITFFLATPVIAADRADQENPGEPGKNLVADLEDEVIFSANAESPWRFYIGSMANWMVPVEGPLSRSHKSNTVTVRVIDYVERDDAYQAEWGGGLGQVYWQEFNAHDYRALAKAGGALSLVIRVDEKPKKKVELKMDCGYPCGGAVNVTNIFKAVPENQWFRMSVKVSCFADAGANLANIISPMVIATTEDFTMSFADVSLLTNPPPESVIPCN